MMKKNILKYVLLSMTFFLGACNDFFNVETKNVLDHDGYITEESEMYSGYIGIMTKSTSHWRQSDLFDRYTW